MASTDFVNTLHNKQIIDPTESPSIPRNDAVLQRHQWSPYSFTGGSGVAVQGKDYCVVASDTRFTTQGAYHINARNVTRAVQLTDTAVLTTSGSQADATVLHKSLMTRLAMYEHDNGKRPSVTAIAQMLSNMLYYKRFFPYYAFCALGGVDSEGKGCAFSFDPFGSFDQVSCFCSGTGMSLMQPILDNQIEGRQQYGEKTKDCSMEETVTTVKDAFSSAGERDIYTGDLVEIFKITKAGVEKEVFELKMD